MAESIRTLFLVDGEHHPPTVLDALQELRDNEGLVPVGLFFLGGTEKVEDPRELASSEWELVVPGNPAAELADVLRRLRPELVVDLSDLPVTGPGLRMWLASVSLAQGVAYRGADFEFRPPRRERLLGKPSCAVVGTGKRCGKTAVSAELARYLARIGHRPVVVAMGRGGPPYPYLVEEGKVDGQFLLEELAKGRHAASDHYEDALVSGVMTVGSRRCGGGMAGEPFVTNLPEAARLAEGLDADAIILEGSGSSIPPVETGACICVTSAAQDVRESLEYLGPYRILISDGVVITMAEEPFASPHQVKALRERIKRIKGEITIIETVFRPHPLQPIRDKNVFVAVTAPEEAGKLLLKHLAETWGCEVIGISHHLANRARLRRDLEKAEAAEVLLVELKAAAVEVVARFARDNEKELVYFHNLPVPSEPGENMEDFFRTMWGKALERT